MFGSGVINELLERYRPQIEAAKVSLKQAKDALDAKIADVDSKLERIEGYERLNWDVLMGIASTLRKSGFQCHCGQIHKFIDVEEIEKEVMETALSEQDVQEILGPQAIAVIDPIPTEEQTRGSIDIADHSSLGTGDSNSNRNDDANGGN
jgi:hypothetical protein